MRKRKFNIEIWKEKETNFFVITCNHKGVSGGRIATQGKTLKEAFKMLGDAIELVEDKNNKK